MSLDQREAAGRELPGPDVMVGAAEAYALHANDRLPGGGGAHGLGRRLGLANRDRAHHFRAGQILGYRS
jgi:hypothetical protein